MKTLFAFALLTLSATTFAQEITPIVGANIICSQEGGAVFINTKAKRLWQGDEKTDKTGLEFIVKKFSVFRCPNCYQVEATLPMMEESGDKIIYNVSGNTENFKKAFLKVTGVHGNGQTEEIGTIDCDVK